MISRIFYSEPLVRLYFHSNYAIKRFAHSTAPALRLPTELVAAIQTKARESKSVMEYLRGHASSPVDSVTVQTALGGMRGAQVLLCETSAVDPNTGLKYRGFPIQQLVNKMPSYVGVGSSATSANPEHLPSSEGLFWLLLTGSIPDINQVELLRKEISSRMKLPEHVTNAVRALPKDTHPMTQLITGIAACQTESSFMKMYASGATSRTEYWKYALEDGLTLFAKLPALASLIYRRISVKPELSLDVPIPDTSVDWAGNVAHMMGFDSTNMAAVMRLYMFLHADHEGGNVSAHAAHLVGSALADPYLAYAASMAGLAGPLHGLANQQCLEFFRKLKFEMESEGKELKPETVKDYIEKNIIQKGRVVPGFGHAVLRVTDPRFTIQYNFAKKTMPNDELFKLLNICLEVVPPMLKATGKAANPYPNIDAHSGIILNHYGLQDEQFFTVLFGLSRCMGIMSQIVWDRILSLPIERPKSVTLKELSEIVSKHNGNNKQQDTTK